MNIQYKYLNEDKMLWASIIYHFVFGVLIFQETAVRRVTGCFMVSKIFENYDAAAYIITSLISIFGLIVKGVTFPYFSVICLLPQQFLLILALTGQIMAVNLGVYPDGYPPKGGSYFLLVDQLPSMIVAVAHSIVVFQKWIKIGLI